VISKVERRNRRGQIPKPNAEFWRDRVTRDLTRMNPEITAHGPSPMIVEGIEEIVSHVCTLEHRGGMGVTGTLLTVCALRAAELAGEWTRLRVRNVGAKS